MPERVHTSAFKMHVTQVHPGIRTLQALRFYRLKVCGSSAPRGSVGTVFPATFAHFTCLTFRQFSQYFQLFYHGRAGRGL